MIKLLIDILNSDNFYSSTEAIEIAKGKYKLPENLKEFKKYCKRQWRLRE